MIFNKKLFFKIQNSVKGPFYRNIGSPQGYKLSPILYIIYTMKLQKLFRNNVKCLLFADDTIIYKSDKNINNTISSLEKTIDEVNVFFNEYGLPLSPLKTQFIIFNNSKSGISENQFQLRVQDTLVKNVKTVKYLGLYFDSKLNWNFHTNYIYTKAIKAINILKYLTGTWWGGHPQTLLNVYEGLMRSKMEYCIYLWLSNSSKHNEKLSRIQNSGIRISMGCRMSTPIRVLHAHINFLTRLHVIQLQPICRRFL